MNKVQCPNGDGEGYCRKQGIKCSHAMPHKQKKSCMFFGGPNCPKCEEVNHGIR